MGLIPAQETGNIYVSWQRKLVVGWVSGLCPVCCTHLK